MVSVHWGALSPILALTGAAFLAITLASLMRGALKKYIGQVFAVLGGVGGLVASWILWYKVSDEGPIVTIADTVRIDHLGLFITGIISVAVVLSSFVVQNFLKREKLSGGNEVFVLLLLSGLGGVLMATSNDLIILFMGLEVLSLSAYILAASHIRKTQSQEAGMKYFVIGAFASAFFLYGIALIYGATGSTKLAQIAEALDPATGSADNDLLLGGLALFLVGLLFKVSAVPFHAWTPDVYEGAPSPFVAFMASAVKVAGFSALIKVLGGAFIERVDDWQPIIYAVSIASMAVGTLAALVQTNVKRILAYSSISHAGYILLGIQAGTLDGFASSLWYLAAYAMLALGSFTIITASEGSDHDSNHIDNYRGLATRQPLLAVFFAVLLLAQAGIPPTSGFYAKFSVISAVLDNRTYPLAIVAMIIAIAAAFIYLKLLVVMFFVSSKEEGTAKSSKEEPPSKEPPPKEQSSKIALPIIGVVGVTVVFTIAMGVYPVWLLDLAQAGVQSLV